MDKEITRNKTEKTAARYASLAGLTPAKSRRMALSGETEDTNRVEQVLIFILDGSESMAERLGSDSKIEVAYRLFHDKLAPNLAGWAYGIIVIKGDRESYWVVAPTKSAAALAVASPEPSGYTPLAQGLEMSWGWIREHARRARFVVISDGLPNDLHPSDILSLAKKNASIPIDTVGIGDSRQTNGIFTTYNPDFLRELSRITGGKFYEVQTAGDLGQAIFELTPKERPLLGDVKLLPPGNGH